MYDGICIFDRGQKGTSSIRTRSKRSNTFNEILETGRFSFSC